LKRRSRRRTVSLGMAFVYSVLLHALLLGIAALHRTDPPPAGDQGEDSQKMESDYESIKDKPVEVSIVDVPNHLLEDEAAAQAAWDKHLEDCSSWYGGIGLMVNPETNEVIKVYPRYPAYRYGIREGDFLETEPRGEVGTIADVWVRRGDQELDFQIPREKICTEDTEQ
jgi:hypothetical protein